MKTFRVLSMHAGARRPIFAALVLVALAAGGPFDAALGQQPALGMAPVELLACRYADGKGPGDLEGVAAAFNAWMESEEAPPYSAYAITPQLRSADTDFDVAWLGAWPSGAGMGESMAHWFAAGAELAPVFDEVLRCHSNVNYAVLTLRPPAEPGRFGPLEVSSCTLRLGARIDAAVAAVSEWIEAFARSGSSAAHWILFPAYGESGNADYSFKWAAGYSSYEAFGRDYDEFYNGGGVDRFAELLDPLVRCDSPRLYSVRPVRVESR